MKEYQASFSDKETAGKGVLFQHPSYTNAHQLSYSPISLSGVYNAIYQLSLFRDSGYLPGGV